MNIIRYKGQSSAYWVLLLVLVFSAVAFFVIFHNQIFALIKGSYTIFYVKNKNTVSNINNLFYNVYGSLQRTYNILSNPQEYLIQSQVQSTPNNNSVNTYIDLNYISPGTFTINKNGLMEGSPQLFQFSISLPQYSLQNTKVEFYCYIQASCLPQNFSLKTAPESLIISNSLFTREIECLIPNINLNYYNCSYNPTFDFNVGLNATLENLKTYTSYNFLIVSSNIYELSYEKGESVYQLLNLDSSKFDINTYSGIQGLPVVYIFRANSASGLPELLFGQNITYDNFIVYISPLQNLQSINNFNITFYYNPNQINFEFLNIGSGSCSSSITYKSGIYSYLCRVNNGYSYCSIKINNDLLYYYQSNGEEFYIPIPVCIKAGKDFSGYAEVNILSYMNYNYFISSNVQETGIYV